MHQESEESPFAALAPSPSAVRHRPRPTQEKERCSDVELVPEAPRDDVIFVNGATEVVPEALCRQLSEGGRLVTVMTRAPTGRAMLYRWVGGEASGWPIFDAAAPLLPGFAKPPEFVF